MCIKDILLSSICGAVYQPRHQEVRDTKSLLRSILSFGLLSPITVRKDEDGFRVISGNRRVTTLRRILEDSKAQQIPEGNARAVGDDIELTARVLHNITDKEAAFQAFAENEEREDLTPLDRAWFYMDMVDNLQSTEDEIASRLAINRGTVISRINLLKSIPGSVLDAWKGYRITWGHV